jgi:hypothetical protein
VEGMYCACKGGYIIDMDISKYAEFRSNDTVRDLTVHIHRIKKAAVS